MPQSVISVEDLTMAYGSVLIQKDLNFSVNQGDIFVIMGGSGCGKSTLLRHMIGLSFPLKGDVRFGGQSLVMADSLQRQQLMKKFGVLFQTGGLLSSLTLGENISLPLTESTQLSAGKIREIVAYKLALVGLAGFEDYYPLQLSGGMQKRAGLARAMALDPEILFFDEPSAGLDPVTSKHLDDLILRLRESLETTIVIVTHELSSIFAIGNNGIFLDAETKTLIAQGSPQQMLATSQEAKVLNFLYRGNLPSAEGHKNE